MSTIYHLGSGLIYDCLLSSNKSERHCILNQMNKLSPGDVLVLDRGYFSYLLLHQAVEKGIHLICRLQSGTMNENIKTFFDNDSNDTVIEYYPSAAVKSEIKKQGYHINYKIIKLRLIKYQIADEKYICATTLIGNQYPLDEFPRVYHGRWGIEELYKISKEFIDVEDFHSKNERGVKQELYAHALLINIARIFELEANSQLSPQSSSNQNDKKKGCDSYPTLPAEKSPEPAERLDSSEKRLRKSSPETLDPKGLESTTGITDSYLMCFDIQDSQRKQLSQRIEHAIPVQNAHIYIITSSDELYYIHVKNGKVERDKEKIIVKQNSQLNIKEIIEQLGEKPAQERYRLLPLEKVRIITSNTSHTQKKGGDIKENYWQDFFGENTNG